MAIEIRVPTLGESVTEASIGQWFKKVGETVKADEPLVELETDKVTLEVPAPSDGVLVEIVAEEGETVNVDALLASFASESEGGAAPAPAPTADTPAAAPVASSEAVSPQGGLVDVVVPSGGESVTEAEVGEWYKKVGDPIAVDDAIVELETDKAAQEVMAQVAGVLEELVTPTGSVVEVGAVLARIRAGATISPAGSKVVIPEAQIDPKAQTEMPASPAASRVMAENKVSANSVAGSGKRGQILKEDVMAAMDKISATPAPVPSAPVAAPTPVAADGDEVREERVRMTRLRQTIARRLKDAQNTAAMLTTFNEVDMGPVMDLRKQYKELFEKKHGVKLGFMGFFTKAVCHALNDVPAVNAEVDGTDLVYKNYAHIGVAVGTAKGLVVPVVRDADQMSIAEIEQEIGNLGRKARDGALSMNDMQGGTFTISNGGVYGSLMSTPILNAPQSGILGMHKIQDRAMVVGGEIVVRPMMYLALSYDHRIVDGKEAVTFLVRIKESLEDPQRLILDL